MRRGFTLLELSIVLVLISLVLGGGLVTLNGYLQASQYNTTVARMNAIDAALLNYSIASSRIPCPSDLAQLPSSANYGVEAANPGACTGGTPAATFVAASGTAEGGVPTRTLRLSDDFLYDGWGRRLRYAVDPVYTASTSPLPVASACSLSQTPDATAITINDATGASRSAIAAYAIISHGANGHGAYTSNAVMLNAGSTNANELTNCHCNSSAVSNASYIPTYVQMTPTLDPSSTVDNFDDIVTYKEAWQLQKQNSQPAGSSFSCATQYLAVVGIYGPAYPIFLSINNGVVTVLPVPAQTSCWEWAGAGGDISPNNQYVAWGGSMYNDSGNCTKAGVLYNFAPSGLTYAYNNINAPMEITAVKFSPNGSYLAVAGAMLNAAESSVTSHFLNLYSLSGGASPYSTLVGSGSPAPTFGYAALTWSPDGNTIYGSDGGPPNYGVDVYSLSGTSLTFVKTISGGAWTTAAAIHPSGTYLAMNGNGSEGNGPYVIANPLAASPQEISGTASGAVSPQWNGAAWSPNGNYLAGTPNATGVAVYKFTPASAPVYFTPETVSGYICGSGGHSAQFGNVAFSKDNQYLAVVGSFNYPNPDICIYQSNASGTVWNNVYTGCIGCGLTGGIPIWSH